MQFIVRMKNIFFNLKHNIKSLTNHLELLKTIFYQ